VAILITAGKREVFSVSDEMLDAQNLVKNNFCAGINFRDVYLTDFVALQKRADALVGGRNDTKLPSERVTLKNLDNGMGEGSAVRFTGYIMDAHYSDVGHGESVNCHAPGSEANDIHADLVNRADEVDRCQSITAEISPHMRPAKWEVDNLETLAQGKALVRIGGQLMYDASHRPCSEGRGFPQRLFLESITAIAYRHCSRRKAVTADLAVPTFTKNVKVGQPRRPRPPTKAGVCRTGRTLTQVGG
jgi:hypothetical protein